MRCRRAEAACPRLWGRSLRGSSSAESSGCGTCTASPVRWCWCSRRRFRCDTPGCAASFTESTAQIPARKRLTGRLRQGLAVAADGPLDRVGGEVVSGQLAHRLGFAGRGGAGEGRRAARAAASPPGGRRDELPEAPAVHDRHHRPGDVEAVGHLRGPLQGRAHRPAAGPRRRRSRGRGSGDRPVRAVSGRGARAAAARGARR